MSSALLVRLLAVLGSDANWATDVAPILHRHCVACHRPGQSAPFSLLSYDDARKHARQIAQVTAKRRMPPWLPEPGFGVFANERRLSEAEIETLARFAELDAPSGDLAQAPAPPSFAEGWLLGQPDQVVQPVQAYVLPSEGSDVYRNFVVPIAFPPDDGAGARTHPGERFVAALEFLPGNPKLVHHAMAFVDPLGDGRKRDAADAEPGFGGMAVGEAESPDGHFLGWAPGRLPKWLPADMAWRLPDGADLIVQLHLLPTGKPESLLPQIGLHFTDVAPTRWPLLLRVGTPTIDIAAGAADYAIDDSYTLPIDVEVLSVTPHAHYLGKVLEGFADLPDGTRRWLIRIPQWDFSWQDEYPLAAPLPLPKGSVLRMHFTYDNSDQNPRNPRHPPVRVQYGPDSSDEMGSLWVQVLPRAPDERPLLAEDFGHKVLRDRVVYFEGQARRSPQDPVAQYDYATALLEADRVDEAAVQFERTLALEPGLVSAWVNLGLVNVRRDELATARVNFEAALRLKPDHENARKNLALVLERRGELAEAVFHWKLLLARTHDPGACRSLAWTLATAPDDAVRDGKEAMLWAKRVAQKAPKDPLVLDTLGAAYAEMGRWKDALAAVQSAIEAARDGGDEELARKMEERQAAYREHRPWRQQRVGRGG